MRDCLWKFARGQFAFEESSHELPAANAVSSGRKAASPIPVRYSGCGFDVSIATRHVLLATDPGLEIYGWAHLGMEGDISPMI